MEPKKTSNADVEKWKSFFFLIGLLFSIGSVIIAFEWRSSGYKPQQLSSEIVLPEKQENVTPTRVKREEPEPKQIPPIIDTIICFPPIYPDTPSKKSGEVDDRIFTQFEVDDQPSYPGGESELLKFIRREIEYPKQAKENGIEGTVVVNFIVDANGNITNVKIAKGVTDALDKEAKRVVRNMPKWDPGKQRGKKVQVRMNLPIRFSLQN